MAKVELKQQTLIVNITGLRKLWALKSQIKIPLAHVTGVTADPGVWHEQPKLLQKRYGTTVNGVYFGGTFMQDGDKVFWDVRNPENAIVISLKNEEYARLVVDVANPEEVVNSVEKALSQALVA